MLMPLSNIIRRRLLRLLQPWLRELPEFEVKLGLKKSCAVARNLQIDTSVLNQLFDEPAGLFFKDVTIEHLTVRFSLWSSTAFTVEVHGVHITLSPGEQNEEGYLKRLRKRDTSSGNVTKKLSALDPEGCSLHCLLERILCTVPSGNEFSTTLLNLILKHCHLEMHKIHVDVKFPILNDVVMGFWELKEFNARSKSLDHGCLLRGIFGALFFPLKENPFIICGIGFKIRFGRNDHTDRVLLSSDLFTCINLSDLKLVDFRLQVPELVLSFSPDDISICLAFSKLLSDNPKHIRSGRQLWRLAASKIGHLTVTPRVALYKLVGVVVQWLEYVIAYESLLLLIGYSTDQLLKRSIVEMSQDRLTLASAKHQWKVISGIEKELPAEGIALGRRVARHRAALNGQCAHSLKKSSVSSPFNFLCLFLLVLSIIWKKMCNILRSIGKFLKLVQDPKIYGQMGIVCEGPFEKFCFILNLKKVIITVFPMSEIQPSVNEKLQSQLGLPYSDFLIFCVSINALSLAYVEDIYEWNLFMSCGQLEIKPSFLGGSSVLQTSTANVLNSGKGHRTGASNDMKSILWVEPAQRSLVSESNAEGSCDPFLESLLREMWSNWKRVCMSFDEGEIEYTENLFLLCEMESSLAYPGLKNTDYGFCKYSLTLGKLNLDMTYSSILSASLLLSQMQHAFLGNKDKGRVRVHLDSRVKPELCWGSKYECFSVGLIMTIFGMLPEKHIQLGVFVAGPCIQLSCDKKLDGTDEHKGDIVSQDDIQLTFQLHDIEAAVWSPSIFDMAPLTGMTGLEGIVKECPRLEPHTIEIPKPNNGKNVSHRRISVFSYIRVNGLNIHMGSTTENKQFQLFVLKPIIVQLSSIREFAYSLGTNVVTFSAAVGMMAAGFTAFSYMDELYLLCQVFVGLSSAVSYFFSCSESDGHVCPKLMRQEILFVEAENEQTTVGGASLTNCSCLFLINGTFRLESVDLILQRSRTSDNVDSFIKSYDALCSKNLVGQNWPDCGTWISFQQISIELSCEKGKMELLTDLSGIQALLFEHQNEMGIINDHIALNNLQLQSLNCLYEISLLDCKFTLGPPQSASSSTGVSKPLDNSNSGGDTSHMLEKPLLTINSGKPNDQSHSFVHEMGSTSSILSQPSCHWLLLNMALGNIFIGKCSMKDVLVGSHQLNKLLGILSVGGEFQTISWSVQGGLVVIETTVLAKFVCHFSSYLHCVSNIISAVRPSDKHILKADGDLSTINLNNHLTEVEARESLCTSQHDEGDFLNAVAVDVSKFSLALVLENESGDIGELVIEVDFRLKFERGNTGRKFLFDLSHLSILSQVLRGSVEDESETPHFSSVTSNVLSPHFVSGLPASGFQGSDEINSVNDASCSRDPLPFSLYSSVPKVFKLSHQNHILKHLSASMSVERPEYGPLHLRLVWFGTGSVSSFDITVTLSEVEMMLSMATSFSGVSSWDAKGESIKNHQSSSQRPDNSMEALVPDGAIVAIQDVHQHMYFTVEGGESNFSLGGAIHYSLVGERALFRVKYCKRRRWKSTVLWFSLISLYAKNTLGESLRLNYCPGSGFVDISSNTDGGGAVWRALPCEPESSMGVIDWEPYHQLVNRTLYLVNGKNDSGVAFVDEVPEFVRKPGSPFKLKVFHDLRDVVNTDSHPTMTSGTSLGMHEGITFQQGGKLPHVDIRIEEITLNIVHELSDTADLFPLLRGCINNTQLIIQTLPTKFRVISTFNAAVLYFVGQLNLWRQLLHPVDICFFYRSSFHSEGPEHASHGVPVNIYCRTKRLCISLSELSLDTLLFVIGKLNLSGPYPVRSFTILANCCKVENQSGLNLLCHFYDTQRVSISRKQSTSILLRKRSDLANQTLEVATPVSVQLVDLGSFATSSIRLSISEAQTLAWRTRIMSVKDSRTYPGPFLVASISRKTKDGLSVVISPLIKISNETGFSMELRFLRPQPNEDEFASVLLKPGDSIDDSMAMFDAIKLSGGVKKALMSLSVGNFLFSFRPEMTEDLIASKHSLSAEWSEDLKGGKAVVLSGIFDKLSYRVRRTLSVKSVKCSFSTASCALSSEGAWVSNMHFLIQTIGRDVPVIQPEKSKEGDKSENLPVALQEQKEIYLLPTVRVTNLLQSEIHVLLSETGLPNPLGCNSIGKQAAISCGCTVDFYANPAIIYFTVTLIASTSSSKPVNSGDLVKKLMKQKVDVHHLDIDLDFEGGAYFATLRLSRGNRGILEAVVFTSYALKNNTEYSVYVLATNKKHLFRNEVDRLKSDMPMERGLFLPPKSTRSWFLKSKKVQLKLPEDHTSEALLDLDALSGLTEISLNKEEECGFKSIIKLGVSTGPFLTKVDVPSQTVTLVPRYVVCNESEEKITVRQSYLQDDMACMTSINSKEQRTLWLRGGFSQREEFNLFENVIRKHKSSSDDSLLYVQFRTDESELGWSGPVCIASLGRFFLKFRKATNQATVQDRNTIEFAAVHVVEEGSTLVLRFYKPPNISLPYRIENCLRNLSITYYQKGSLEPEVLGSACSVGYVWDDLTLPHRLVVRINDGLLLQEIKLDKVRPWKPLYKHRQHSLLAPHLLLDKKSIDWKPSFSESDGREMLKVGYEIYADGPTRVLRICEISQSFKGDTVFHSYGKIQLRISQFAVHLLEHANQDGDENEKADYTPIMIAKLENMSLDTVLDDRQKYNQFTIQSLNLELKWVGAPFAAMLRRHQLDYNSSDECVLKVVFVLLTTSSNVKQVKYSSIFLQPIDLNLDEETMMRIIPFWRSSLSDSQSQQFYFDHFEIHPIKIIANFIPGESHSSYSTAQETIRSFLHSVIKVPPMKNMVVELNGVLVTHALITMRELFVKCAQHYSWYAVRAIYIAKGSPLLPPDFVSIFDDLASSSLDVFFDPSRGLMNLPGFTLGTFKLISKCIKGEGFSGTKRYFGDLGKTLRTAGSNVLFAAVTEISDSVLKGAETSGFNGMVTGFHQGILKLAMEPALLGTALMEGGPDRKIKLDQSPGVDELYIEGYLQAMLDTIYRQEYLRVRVIDNQVFLKNLPPNNSLIDEIMDRVKEFLVSKALLKGDPSTSSRPLRHLRGETEWRIGPTVLTLCEHLFVSFAIRMLRKNSNKFMPSMNWNKGLKDENHVVDSANASPKEQKVKFMWKWGIGKFVLSGVLAYIDGRLCRCIPNPIARRIVSGFLLSFLDKTDNE